MKILQHFKTITYHRWLVRQGCFKVGLYWQGLTHDLSKYSPTEFWVGARYFQGTRSPNGVEREQKGYSEAWMHHKGLSPGRNKLLPPGYNRKYADKTGRKMEKSA